MLGRVSVIVLNTYRESVRARVLIGLFAVAFGVALYSLIVGSFSLKSATRVVADLGAASISIFSVVVAVVIGATSLHRELEQKTIFPILARPISRTEYLLGKFFGTALTIFVFIAADTGLVMLLAAALGDQSPLKIVAAVLLPTLAYVLISLRSPKFWTFGVVLLALALFGLGFALSGVVPEDRQVILSSSTLALLEVSVIIAWATLFSSFSTPFLSAAFTVSIFFIGRSADDLAKLPTKQFGPKIHDLGIFVSKIVPNLQIFVPPRPLLAGEVADSNLLSYVGLAALTSLGWTTGLLAAASIIFKRRDFV